MRITKVIWVVGALSCWATLSSIGGTFSVYSVGNSLTDDMMVRGFRYCAATYENSLGNTYIFGSVYRPSTSLPYLYNFPTNDSLTKSLAGTNTAGTYLSYPNYTPWTTALPNNNWDVMTLQSYGGPIDTTGVAHATQGTDTTAVDAFITAAHRLGKNAATRFYIFEPWPSVKNFYDTNDYSVSWLTSVANSSSQTMILCRGYFQNLFEAVKTTNASIGMIPVGEVFYALDAKMKAGLVAGFTNVQQLHRDAYHLNNFGVDVAGFTAYATIFKQSPVGLADNPSIGTRSYAAPYTDPSAAAVAAALPTIQQTVWQVVTQQSYFTLVLPAGPPAPTAGFSAAATRGFALVALVVFPLAAWVIVKAVTRHRGNPPGPRQDL